MYKWNFVFNFSLTFWHSRSIECIFTASILCKFDIRDRMILYDLSPNRINYGFIFYYFRLDLVLNLNIFSFGLKYMWFASVFRWKKKYFARFQLRSLSKKSFNWMFYPCISFIKTQKFTLRFTHSLKNREHLSIWLKNYLKSFNLNLQFRQNTENFPQLCCQLLSRIINGIFTYVLLRSKHKKSRTASVAQIVG